MVLIMTTLALRAAEGVVELKDLHGATRTPLATKEAKAVVLLFLAPDCPISNAYVPEINRITKDYAPKPLAFYLVYVDADLVAADVKKHVEQFSLTAPALLDPKHTLAKKVKATVTPQAVVVSPGGKVIYRGRIDDLYVEIGQRQQKAKQHDLRNALEAILAGKKVTVAETKAVGCFIGDGK
jgi:thiol-disulfide isomerase/thioredoxin